MPTPHGGANDLMTLYMYISEGLVLCCFFLTLKPPEGRSPASWKLQSKVVDESVPYVVQPVKRAQKGRGSSGKVERETTGGVNYTVKDLWDHAHTFRSIPLLTAHTNNCIVSPITLLPLIHSLSI